ncbi:hypothetical protein ACN47E_002774 [Coniothyrium glycines]
MSQKDKRGRKFFQQLQPTFSIDVPKQNITKLQFLDDADPGKDAIVRKKAREWVNRNKELSMKTNEGRRRPLKGKSLVGDDDESVKLEKQVQQQVVKLEDTKLPTEPQQIIFTSATDPFSMLPSRDVVGRNYDHIIQFFLYGCPEEIPCSDDKYSDKSTNSLISFSPENTVLGNMAKSDATFILWLYATVSIRDGMQGNVDTEEVQFFYNRALRVLQSTIQKEADAGIYTDHLVNCLACITATASFSGMYKTAELHRDALVRVLGIRGDGDVLKGLLSAVPWTVKAVQWCEIMVATQLVELPKIPYLAQTSSVTIPEIVIQEASQATKRSMANLPPLSEAFHRIFGLAHLLGACYAKLRKGEKVDNYIIRPLYDFEYALLEVLKAQKAQNHGYTEIEVLLAEALQLYFWTGPRMLPPQTRLCDLLISRTMRALLRLLHEYAPALDADFTLETPASVAGSVMNWATRPYDHPRTTSNAITWSLALGVVISEALCRPEHSWFKEHLCLQLKHLGMDKNEEEYQAVLRMFPTTDGFAWISLKATFAKYLV